MILRRLTEHVKTQNWFAVALDFVIVVAGVFIGIQVSNWNAARQTRISAAEFHQRLLTDMRMEATQYAALQKYFRSVLTAAEATHADVTGEAALTDAELMINAFRASQYSWAERHRATFDELVGSGNLDLIEDVRLRTRVAGYYAMELLEEVSRDSQNSEYRRAFRMSAPPDLHEALNRQCGDRQMDGAPTGTVTLDYDCKFEWPPAKLAEAAAALRSNADLPYLLRLHIANLSGRDFTLQMNRRAYELDAFIQQDESE